jgi:hypothetical protein
MTPSITYTANTNAALSSFYLPSNSIATLLWTGSAYRLLRGSRPVGQQEADISGTAIMPAYSFSADLSTGIHLAGTSQLTFDTSGIARMTISNSNVGIGTTIPATTLDVSGGATIRNGLRIPYYTITTGSYSIASSGYGSLYNITTSALSNLTWPVVTMPGDSNAYWILRNSTGVYLSVTSTYSTAVSTGTALPSPMSIAPGTSVNVMVVYPGNVLSYIMF